MRQTESKWLVALDASSQSHDVARYLCRLLPPNHSHVVLFHVDALLPEAFLDAASPSGVMSQVIPLDTWIARKQKWTKHVLTDVRKMMVAAGFDRQKVVVKLKKINRGIARDILDESHDGYTGLLMGRSENLDRIDLSLGSVANKLVSACGHLPLAVVDGQSGLEKILIGFDGSEGAMKSVAFVAETFNTDTEVTLCHIIRSLRLQQVRQNRKDEYHELFSPEHVLKWQKVQKKKILPAIDRARRLLIDSGWQSFRVHRKIILDADSRAQCLLKEARGNGYGTIVLGRRGLSVVRDFLIGRVGQKVVAESHGLAVWIVN